MVLRKMAIVIGILWASTVQGSQLDERLDQLFHKLQTSEAKWQTKAIESEIHTIWMENEQEEINLLMRQGISAMKMEKYPLALQIFNLMIQKAPDFAEAWNKRALTHYLMEDYEASVKDIQKTILLEPRHFSAMSGLGFIYVKLGQYEKALKVFEKIAQIHPQFDGLEQYMSGLKRVVNAHRT